MVFKKRTKNHQVGDTATQAGTVKLVKHKSSRKKILKISGIILAVILVVIAGFWLMGDSAEEGKITDEQKYAKNFIESDNSKETQARLVEEYGPKYDETAAKVSKSNPGEWDKAALDDAYAVLLYADKMQAYTQASYFLNSIEAARNAGLNIDDNSYGVNQDLRDQIQKRISAATEKSNEIDPKVKAELEKVL